MAGKYKCSLLDAQVLEYDTSKDLIPDSHSCSP